MCGVPLLFAGVLATAVSLFDPPDDTIERLGAGAVGAMGLVFGVGFLVLTLPERFGIGGLLWRWCGWLVPVALLPFALTLLSFPAQVADRSDRIGSSAAAVIVGALLLYLAWTLARLWFTSVRARPR